MHMNTNKNRNIKKSSKGRQKISITKIASKANLQVTFSKRRTGLFKKAGELCVLCGAEIAILVFSPKEKPYSFAHPDLYTVLSRYLNEGNNAASSSSSSSSTSSALEDLLTVANNPLFKQFNEEYEEALRDLEKEKKKIEKEASRRESHVNSTGFWWEMVNVDELELEDLEEYVNSMEELKRNVARRMKQQMIEAFAAAATANHGGGLMGLGNYFGEQGTVGVGGGGGGGGDGVGYGFGFGGWQHF